jgi:putative spermidine/putrescine transport system permease protein
MFTYKASSAESGAVGGRGVSRFLHRHRNVRLVGLLFAPMTWLVLAYLGSLAALLITSFYSVDSFTTKMVKEVGLGNYRDLLSESVFRRVTLRTVGVAAAVTVVDLLLALPIAFYLAKVASARVRQALVVATTIPLWASYIVKAYAWRTFLDPAGGLIKKLFGGSPGFGLTSIVIVLAYLWLPFAILPIYAGLERLPDSLLEASADLGGHGGVTIRRVIVPILTPALIAATIFTFSLSLGDYITVDIVGGKTQMIGSVIYDNFGPNPPLAAAFAVVPFVAMVIYIGLIRRTGALENL